MNQQFLRAGLIRSKVDPCVYYRQLGKPRGIVSVFVDDDTMIAETEEGMAELKRMIGSKFQYHGLGPVHHLLGVRISQEKDNSLYLDQEVYIDKILERFGMPKCYSVATPLEPGNKLSKGDSPTSEEERARVTNLPYRELVGSLMYLAQSIWPDICYTVAKLGQFANNPGWSHWSAGKRVLRYLKGTKTHKCQRTPPESVYTSNNKYGTNQESKEKQHVTTGIRTRSSGVLCFLGRSHIYYLTCKHFLDVFDDI